MPPPKRIISLISSATEVLYGLGLGNSVVGISHECDFPSEVQEHPRVTFSRVNASASSSEIDRQVRESDRQEGLYGLKRELICDLRPDLIITQSQCDVCAVRFEDVASLIRNEDVLKSTALIDLNPQSLSDVLSDVQRIAVATETTGTARQYLKSLQDRIDHVKLQTEQLSDRPRVACIEWTEPLMLAGNWTPELIHLAGGQSSVRAGVHSKYTPWDRLIEEDPQVVVISPCGFDLQRSTEEAKSLQDEPGWNAITAVVDQRVYVVDGNAYLNRSGPRLVDSVEILAHLIHPTVFPAPSFTNGWCQFGV